MIQILKTMAEFNSKYKGILLLLDNDTKIFFKVTEDSLPHLLGLKKISLLEHKSNTSIIKRIQKGNINNKTIQRDSKISKDIKKTIHNKRTAINYLIDNYKDVTNISIHKDVQYKTYKSCFVIKIKNAILCLNINYESEGFYSCHLRSIRLLGQNSKENIIYSQEHTGVIEVKWSKK